MLKRLSFILGLTFSLLFTQCEHNPVAPEARELTELEKRLVESDNKFGFKLFNAINKTEGDKNIFISPLSVSMALGMTLNGANGETKTAMEETLELAGMTTEEINQSYQSLIALLTRLDHRVIFDIANSIWYKQEMAFEAAFIDLNKTYFDATVQPVDFDAPDSTADLINSWVKENTNGRIERIVGAADIDSLTVMFLINAIYFKGTWTYRFDEDKTQDDWFNLPDGSRQPIKMMRLKTKFNYLENELFEAADLPYGNGLFSLTVFLPHIDVDADSLIALLSQPNWDQWMNALSAREFTLAFPRFTLQYELSLNEILKALGMEIAFDQKRADFSRMYSGPERLFIDEIKHKTFVKVDEKGTEAAAVASVEGNQPTSQPLMRVDRPFVFAIRENHSQAILFIGKIVEPNSE